MKNYLIIIGILLVVLLNALFWLNSPFMDYYPHLVIVVIEIVLGAFLYKKISIIENSSFWIFGGVSTLIVAFIVYLQLL